MRRFIAGLVIAAAAAALSGCGGSSAGDAAAPPATTAAPAVAAVSTTAADTTTSVYDPSCKPALEPLADELSSLDSRLSVGMNFENYSQRVGDVRVAYDRIDFDSLDEACIGGPGVQLEKALNSYTRAYRVWNTCIEDVNCSTDSIDKLLQQHWARATRQIKNAKVMLQFG